MKHAPCESGNRAQFKRDDDAEVLEGWIIRGISAIERAWRLGPEITENANPN
ncbi:MAG: hypothetical protein JW896_15360 [Deltaproteobacteria bacterium]|nr:hypothetical protein [Deltaproteobacteria bacterium]